MAKRISKKLLAGLGTSLVFSTTAFISSLGIKSIIDNINDQKNFQFNRIGETSYSQIPNLSTATKDMFIDTTRLGNFHAGSVRKGQTITPWGWLGVYTEDNKTNGYAKPTQQKLALTGWNGEILWVNNDFGSQSFADNKSDIYDIKYDWNRDWIILARSGNNNGLFRPQNNNSVGHNSLMIDVLEAKTGKRLFRVENNPENNNDLHNFAQASFEKISQNYFNVSDEIDRIQDLYYLDVTSFSKQSNEALAFYMPNFMQLYQKTFNNKIKFGTLPNFAQVLEDFQTIARGWIFKQNINGYFTRIVNPQNSGQINGHEWTFTDENNKKNRLSTTDFYLLANPFWTATNQPNQFVLHFIVANADGDVYHKTIGFNLNSTGVNGSLVLSNFDKTEKIGSSAAAASGIFNIKLKPNEWGNNANTWSTDFINANLRINKNIFDNNMISFAFPIAASQKDSNNFPIFDVAQIKIKANGLIERTVDENKLSSRVFDLGNQILSAKDSKISPWPDANKTSLTHNYNRLISISPFDNTFIYSSMPKLNGLGGIYDGSDNANKFLSFWLVNAKTAEFKPFVISNDRGLKGIIPDSILRPINFLKEGFTFDLKSLDSNDSSINLYFNHSGGDRNDWYGSPVNDGMRSAKIGLFDDIFSSSTSNWTNNITSEISNGQNQVIQVRDNSFATLIHSRADMTKWYARTQFNFDRPGNLWQSNQQINSKSSLDNRVKATVFNAPIPDSKVRQQEGVDLVSHWEIGNGKYDGNTSDRSNYERLTVKRPVIKASNSSAKQVLNIATSYDITDKNIAKKYNDLLNLNNQLRDLTFEFNQEIKNASWQIFSSWNQQAKMLTHAISSDDISTFTSSLTQISSAPQWYDARQNSTASNPNNLFGKVHNAISPNTAVDANEFSLRTMLKIEKPANPPGWLNRADQSFFEAYPISGSEYGNETKFQDILNQFIIWKSQNIDLTDNQESKSSSLANLTIKAFLEVNPRVIKPGTNSNPKIYKNGSKQILLIDDKNQAIIYDDQYRNERTIYDQSSTSYEQMQNYGYGTNVQGILSQSFKNIPSENSKLLINVDLNDLNSNLLRKNNNQDSIFIIEYQSQQQDKLVIKPADPADQNWFRNSFSSFNKMLNLFVAFEYQNENENPNTDPWKDLNDSQLKLWTDAELKKNLNDNNGQLVLPTNKNDIRRIRVRLVTKTNDGNPTNANDFIRWKNWNANSEKLVSKVHLLKAQKITVDKNWFNLSLITNTTTSLEDITPDILDKWENEIWKKANLNPTLRNKVTIKYSFLSGSDRTNLDKNNLVANLLSEQSKYNDPTHHGIFKLHDPTQSGINGIIIRATFAKVNANDTTIEFVDQNGSSIDFDDFEKLTGIVNTKNIQTTFDLTSYINHLKNNKTNIITGAGGAGTIAADGLVPPILAGDVNNVLFANESFKTIENWLKASGLEFMWSIDGNGPWNTTENTNKYNAQTGKLFLGIENKSSNLNVKLDSKLIINPKNNSFNEPIIIELNAPKIINVKPTDAAIMRDFFTGNTKYLNVDVDKIKEKIDELLARQGNQFSNAPLTLMVQVGSEEFVDYKKVAETLKRNSVDVSNNVITVKFAIDQSGNNISDFQLIKGGDAEITLINDQRIKIFINDQGLFDNLKTNSSLIGKNNTDFAVAWANGWNVDSNTGVLNTNNNIGHGLRLEFSFADLKQDSNNIGTDPNIQWVKKIPTSYELNQKKLYIRIQTLPNYVYEKIESHQTNSEITPINQDYKFSLDLNLPQLIKVESNLLNQPFANQQIDLENLSTSNFDAYENSVKNLINYDQDTKNKISIRYSFDIYDDLTKEQLIDKIEQYKTSYNEENKNFGILQLWNNNVGKTISSKFVKTDPKDENYELEISGNNNHFLDLSQIFTTINLTNVLSWLETIKVEIKPDGDTPNSISKLVFKPINSPNDLHFHQKTWEQFKQILNNFNIDIQFKSLNQTNSNQPESDWVNSENLLTSYDPNIGKIQIRLRLDNTKTGNIKLKLSNNEVILGSTDKPTKAFDIKLAIKLNVRINDKFVQEFVNNQDTVKGDTKFLNISEINESVMLEAIKNENLNSNPEFNRMKLSVEYQMGNNQDQWRKRDDFIKYLKDQTVDQTSNKISFRFVIDSDQDSDFSVNDDAKVLHNYETPNLGIKIPYFINKNEWEINANNIAITGNNKNITWEWANLTVDQNNLVTTPAGQGLKIQFSTKAGINYNDSESTDLTKGWTNTRPLSLPIDTNDLYIRLIPSNDGFIYESKLDKTATVHKVILDNFKFLIPVENQWLTEKLIITSNNFIDQLRVSDLENYETRVLNNINPSNFKNYVGLTYKFNGESGLTKEELVKKIQQFLNDFSGPNLGILQLDNGIQGHQIEATFINKSMTNGNGRNYEIFEQTGKFNNKINTNEIKTNIDLKPYITYLKNNPIKVDEANSVTGDLNRIIMPNFPAGNFVFGGTSYEIMDKRLDELGIKFEIRALGNGVSTNWVSIEELKKYDPNNGKIQLRLSFDQQKAKNIVLSILNDNDQNNTTTPIEIQSSLKVPLKVQINNKIVDDNFINNDSISGNTRFLNIDAQKEQALINSIIDENKKINSEFEKLRGKLKILYQIEGSNDWKEINAFQEFLKNSQKNWTSNKIKFHFIVEDNLNDFIIDSNEFILHNEEIGNKATKVKIYIHDQNYESLSNQIAVSGTSSNLKYHWPTGLPVNSTTGQIDGINGLKIQYTTKKDQDNADYDNSNQDPANGWVNQLVTKIDPFDRYLAIQFVATDGYVYGPQFKKQNQQPNDQTADWSIHKIDSINVISEIAIDMNPLEQISFNGEFPKINLPEIKMLEQKVKAQVNPIAGLQEKMKFEYQISLGNKILFSFGSLNELEIWMKNYQNPETANLIKFNVTGSIQFATISVRLSAIDSNQYVVLDKNIQGDLDAQEISAQRGRVVNTNNYVTILDLQAYEQILIQNFVQLPEGATVNNISGFNPPGMEKNNGNAFLAGKTYAEIKKILANLGITIQFSAPKNNAVDQWVEQEAIKDLNSKNELFIRFKVNSISGVDLNLLANTFRIKTKTNIDGILNVNNDFATDKIKLKVNLPILITVRSLDLNDEKLKLKGNTWQITNTEKILKEVQALIIKAKNENNTSSTNVENAPLKIQFQLPGLVDEKNEEWFEIDILSSLLRSSNKNWNTNEIKVRWFVDETIAGIDGFRYQISDKSEIVLQRHEESKNALLKMFIHRKSKYSDSNIIQEELKPNGTSQNYEINGLDDFILMLNKETKGLEIQFSKAKIPQNDNDWITYLNNNDLPNPLNSDKDLWFRYEVKDGYEYQDALSNDINHSNKVKIDTSAVKLILELATDWLKKIILNGNLYQLDINDNEAKKLIISSGSLPTGEDDLILFEYSIDNINWFNINEFKELLLENKGKKNDSNFILKREDIKVRFNLKNSNDINNYLMKIDGQIITDENWNNYNVQLITEQLNKNVKGYIELNNLKDFNLNSFAIQGTNNKPKLIVKKRQELETLMQIYASDQLFDILISTKRKSDGTWDWSENKSILLTNNNFIDSEYGLINLGVILDANKQVALKFISKNSNYDIYSEDKLEQDGHILDISENVQITVEITNPFAKQGKTLGLWTRENNNGKYYQGQGGFKIAVADKDTFIIEGDGQQSAQQFLKNSSLADIEKDALEFVYHVFDSKSSLDNQIEIVKEAITNYDDQEIWKSFDEIKENENSDWSKDLNLKVGDYVAVALRVKKEYATKENPFVLKDNEYSMILPIMNDSSNQEQKPGRITGYKINTNAIEVKKNSILINNSVSSQLPPLDGWSELQKVNLKQDAQGNYLGVNLKLELYTEFHEDNSNKVLISGSGLKLVKRETNNENSDVISKGTYKDKDNQEIIDKTGQPVKIWKDINNNRLSRPKKSLIVTKDKLLTSLGGGAFSLPLLNDADEKDRLSLFKNQDIDLKIEANLGEGNEALPDFYLDQNDQKISIKDEVSQQIKFMVENEKRITYSWNQEDFSADKIKYKAPGNNSNQKPEDGNAQIDTIYKLTKQEPGSNPQVITAATAEEASKEIERQLKADFSDQLKFETTYVDKKGQQIKEEGNNIYKFTNLSNKDRIVLRIVAVEEDLFYATDQPPLVINVSGLTEASPDQNRLQYLRVKQGGLIDGQGSFKVLVSNQDNDNEDDQSILNGWKFMLRVWDKNLDDQGNHRIKIPWTDDQIKIKGLANGDKVEWKLVSADGNPVKDAYYNTIALNHQQDSEGNINYQFGQVNYPNGSNSYHLVRPGIGDYPSDDQYPEDSGFVISGLKPALEVFEIDQTSFKSILQELNLVYVGLDKQGTINIDNKYLEGNYWVNTKGEIYLKDDKSKTTLNNGIEELNEIPIKEFLDNLTFFTQDPLLYPYQNGFKFSANDANINDHLANGDHLWAKFEMVRFKNENDSNSVVNSDMTTSSIIWQLPDVSGLTDVSDPINPFWYVLIALAGILTLGTSSLVVFIISRNKKLKR